MIATIARFESLALLRSTQTWIVSAVFALLLGLLFLQTLESYLEIQAQLALDDHPIGLSGYMAIKYLATLVMLFALIAPLFAMRSFSEEYRQNTLALWQSSPVSNTQLVIGKYLGTLLPLSALLLLCIAIPFGMRVFTQLDYGVLASSSLGLFLALALFSAVGLYCSTMTRHVLLAVISALVFLSLLWLLSGAQIAGIPAGLTQRFAITTYLNGFFQGYIAFKDIAYFVVLIILFLTLSIVRLDALRRSGT